MNIFGIIVLNTIFNYVIFKCYIYKNNEDNDNMINELEYKIQMLEKQLLEKNEFIARELQNELI